VFPVLAAAHKALLSKARESLTTRTLHSELVYNYSGSKHVIHLAAFSCFCIVKLVQCSILTICWGLLVTDYGIPETMWDL